MIIEERASTHVYRQKRMFSKEELEAIEHLCVHEQPPYCNAACPLKLDTKAMVAAVAAGDFDKALALYDKVTPFPHILCRPVKRLVKESAGFGRWGRAFPSGNWKKLPFVLAQAPESGDCCGRRTKRPPFLEGICSAYSLREN